MRIGELARKVGVSCDTLRLYERQGLIQSDRRPNGYRDFPDPMLEVVQLIRQAQRLGFTLGEIGQLMQGIQGALDQDQVAEVLREKLAEIDARVTGLLQLRGMVAERLEQACPLGWGGPV